MLQQDLGKVYIADLRELPASAHLRELRAAELEEIKTSAAYQDGLRHLIENPAKTRIILSPASPGALARLADGTPCRQVLFTSCRCSQTLPRQS